MVSFITLHRGTDVDNAKLIAVSADPELVKQFAAALLENEYAPTEDIPDPVLEALNRGRRNAIRLVSREQKGAAHNG